MRRDEAEKMASRRARLRPGAAARHDRRCGGGGDLRVDHALLDLATAKFNQAVTGMHKCKETRCGQDLALGTHRVDGKWQNTAAAERHSDEQFRRPGGTNRRGRRGERRRRAGALRWTALGGRICMGGGDRGGAVRPEKSARRLRKGDVSMMSSFPFFYFLFFFSSF